METPLIQFVNVSKRFGENVVLDGADLSIYKGQITTIIGKSGVGKSVLLKHIIGLLAPDSGEIRIMGKNIFRMKKAQRRKYRHMFSYMFQGNALFDSMTVFDNIALPLKERTRMNEDQIGERVRDKLRQLDILEIEDRFSSQISGGMQKRVALARALVTNPEIVLFDEPTTGLDPIRKGAVHDMIRDYQQRYGFTGVVVSHEIPDIFFISQRIAMLNDGMILFEGSPEKFQMSDHPEIKAFLRGLETRHDDLTGLAPQPQAMRRFAEEMARLNRHSTTFSLIILALENVAGIDRIQGHEAGKTALQSFANQLQGHLRITDTCSRYGLDKLLVLLPHTNAGEAEAVCKKLVTNLRSQDIMNSPEGQGFCFLVSAGVAEAEAGSQLEQVIAKAESKKSNYFQFSIC